MGFPPPLVPHINCEPRRPLPTGRWDWVVCRNALWVNRLWSAIYPGPHMETETAVSPVVFLPEGKTILHRASVPEKGTLVVYLAHWSPEGDPHVSPLITLPKSQHSKIRQLRGAVCSPNLCGPKTRTPFTLQGRHSSPEGPFSAPASSHR
jgi:hypothetical protein